MIFQFAMFVYQRVSPKYSQDQYHHHAGLGSLRLSYPLETGDLHVSWKRAVEPVEPCQTFSDFPEISIYLNETRIKHIPHLYQCVKAEISSKIHVAKKTYQIINHPINPDQGLFYLILNEGMYPIIKLHWGSKVLLFTCQCVFQSF